MAEPGNDIRETAAKPLDAGVASFLREVTTFFGLHRSCSFKVCRRAGACATRHVVCYQALEAEMKPIVLSIRARGWLRAVERGKAPEVSPSARDDMLRLLAWEDEEIALILSGAHGGDDSLTPHQLWLKNFVAEHARPASPAVAGEATTPLTRS